MKEFFLYGLICLINPVSGMEECNYFHETEQKFYTKEVCETLAVQKVNEMAYNFTSEGFTVTRLQIACLVDKTKKNT